MLIVFLIVLPAAFTPGVGFDFGSGLLPARDGLVGFESWDDEGARRPLFGKFGVVAKSETVGIFPVLFRVLVVGSAGNAAVGGPYEGLEGLGKEAAILYRVLDCTSGKRGLGGIIQSDVVLLCSINMIDPGWP